VYLILVKKDIWCEEITGARENISIVKFTNASQTKARKFSFITSEFTSLGIPEKIN
jgi:hypothetical protein